MAHRAFCARKLPGHQTFPTALLLLATAVLNSCGGFQSTSPDPYQIMVLRNPNVRAQSTTSRFSTTPAPLPTPEISVQEFQRISKMPAISGVTTAAAVSPINVGPNSVITTPLGQVVTQQSNYQMDPMTAAGQLFFNRANGTSHYCSAQFVGGTDVVLTAGHCVYDSTLEAEPAQAGTALLNLSARTEAQIPDS